MNGVGSATGSVRRATELSKLVLILLMIAWASSGLPVTVNSPSMF